MVFTDVFTDVTSHGRKIPKSDYQTEGAYPIIDQGQEKIAGYSDCQEVFSDVPVIVFGDHTRKIKYIDEPFLLGADGVKVLKPKLSNVNVKYLYYCLCNVKIPNTGYNRHFKFLKQAAIAIPERKKQDNIVEILDELVKIQELRNREVLFLDELVKARFVEMFGDPETNLFDFEVKSLGDIAFVTKLAGFEYTKYIHYKDSGDIIMVRGLNCKQTKLVLDNIYWIDKSTSDSLPRSQLHKGDIVMTYVGTVGDVALIDQDNKYHLAPNVAKISLLNKNDNNPIYWVNSFMILKEYIVRHASATTQSALSMEKIRNIKFPVPPTYLQNEFANFVQQVDKSKAAIQKSIDETQLLYDSLMQKYFG